MSLAMWALRCPERPPQPYRSVGMIGLAFARGLWRPPRYYAQVDCEFLELIAGIALERQATYAARLATLAIVVGPCANQPPISLAYALPAEGRE